jgi:hypothetical protein
MNISLLSGRYAVWSGTYDGAINDLPRMRAEIVANVTRTLKVAARPQPAQPPAPAIDPAWGRYFDFSPASSSFQAACLAWRAP